MEDYTNDSEIREISKINCNIPNKKEITINENMTKMKIILEQIINSNIKLDKDDIDSIIDNNLFVPFFFKKKPFDKVNSKNIILYSKTSQGSITSYKNIKNNYNKKTNDMKNEGNYGNIIFSGKKRCSEQTKKLRDIEITYDEIKRKYNSFMNNNKNSKEQIIIIYENQRNNSQKEETIIINNSPVCIIYSSQGKINNIFLIKEKQNYDKEDDLIFILEKIKKEFEKHI